VSQAKEWAVVTGATGVFGYAIVARLLQRGLCVLAVARNADNLRALAEAHPAVALCRADVSCDEAIDRIAEQLDAPVRLAVHGPGLAGAGGIMEATPAALVEACNVKVAGLLRLLRAVEPRLVAGSRLVAIAGHYGLEPTEYAAGPGVANAALINLMRQVSLAYGSRGVTAHTLCPGPADSPRLRSVAAKRASLRGSSESSVLETMRSESSIGAFTSPEQVAWAIELLLAPEADAMTGSAIMLDAGRRRGLP